MKKIRIYHDYSAENPFIHWDCMPHIFWEFDREIREGLGSYKELLEGKINEDNAKKLLQAIDYSFDEEDDFDNIVNIAYSVLNDDDTMENREIVLRLLGYSVYSWTSRGYSQGDVASCLLVKPDDYDGDWEENVKRYVSLFDAWSWGDVFGYRIVELIPLQRIDGTPSSLKEEEEYDSCWGFYGDGGLKEIREFAQGAGLSQEEIDYAMDNIIYQ